MTDSQNELWTDASHEALWLEQLQLNDNTIRALQGAMQRIKALEARVEALTQEGAPRRTTCYWCAAGPIPNCHCDGSRPT